MGKMSSVFDEDFEFIAFSLNKEIAGKWCIDGCQECCLDGSYEEFIADSVDPLLFAYNSL